MATRRSYGSYDDGCAAAHALDLIGERWALIIIRELLLGPKRFGDLQRDVIGIGPTALTQRLHELETSGVLTRRELPEPARVAVYDLTDWGRELEAVNAALSLWAVSSPGLPVEAGMSPDTLVLAMRAHARPGPVGGPDLVVGLRLTDSRIESAPPVQYVGTITESGTVMARGLPPQGPAAAVEASTGAWKACIFAAVDPAEAPGVSVSGDADAVRSLVAATRFEPHPASGA
ncbi:winged helix-turn-helix transcriptional regulator [Microlunatus speluncae]|uniref:winged helix-turn-helix transcriptional regulator n=1 Tax=Microlunatus speluncae TaxID=2594267 RepID=UPI0012667C51|nr:helix-turn-helix domain-containing protein [Microlunatus speluncae]